MKVVLVTEIHECETTQSPVKRPLEIRFRSTEGQLMEIDSLNSCFCRLALREPIFIR